MSEDIRPVKVNLPEGARCAIVITYDTDVAGGYAPDGICHGRTPTFLKEQILRLCDTAGDHCARLHFFQIGNGLEDTEDVAYLQEVLERGHDLDQHTYSHVPLVTDDIELLDHELARTNELFRDRLDHLSTVLRGPGGYAGGLKGHPDNQRMVLANGFRWVSCEYNFRVDFESYMDTVSGPAENQPYALDSGLIEVPIMSLTDRNFFDAIMCVDEDAYREWRVAQGHDPVPDGWEKAPWTREDALERWIDYNLAVADHAYENELLWVLCWHPHSHYLHDPQNRALPTLLEWADERDDAVICTLRDAVEWMEVE
jgi:hypothetical protein